MSEPDYDEDETNCQRPCHPDTGCDECRGYWQRMVDEGYWDADREEWTEQGMKEICK